MGPPAMSRSAQEDGQVKAAILRLWDVFAKGEDCAVGREEYEGFVRRLGRVLLPGLAPEQEAKLAANTWEEDCGGLDRLAFAPFFHATLRLAKTWTGGAQDPAELFGFLEDLLVRTTRARLKISSTGEVVESDIVLVVKFWTDLDEVPNLPESDFGLNLAFQAKGQYPDFHLDISTHCLPSGALAGRTVVRCDEVARDMSDWSDRDGGLTRAWAPLEAIVPMGRALVLALKQVEANAAHGIMEIDASELDSTNTNAIEAACAIFGPLAPLDGVATVEVRGATSEEAVAQGTEEPFSLRDVMALGLQSGGTAVAITLRPVLGSLLGKLRALRAGLRLLQPNPALAALLPPGAGKTGEIMKLPTFPDLLRHEVDIDPKCGLARPLRQESLIDVAGLASLAEAFLESSQEREASGAAIVHNPEN